jgi:hypothetical protein
MEVINLKGNNQRAFLTLHTPGILKASIISSSFKSKSSYSKKTNQGMSPSKHVVVRHLMAGCQ